MSETKAVIMSTHILQEVCSLCSKIYIINQGKLVANGTEQQIISETGSKNLEEAFSVNTEVISNKISKVMLVDDIYTTGATIEACSKILCSYGLKTASICVCIGSDI